MLLESFQEAYQRIKEKALLGGCTVQILAAPDVDGVCACRILTHLLRSDNIAFAIFPVNGYTQVQEVIQKAVAPGSDIHSIILLNCGANVNLGAFLPWDLDADISLYVIDCHRPIHLTNMYDRERVWVLDQAEYEPGEVPSDGENLDGEDDSSDEEGDDNGQGGDDDDDDDRQKRRRKDGFEDSDSSDEEEEADLGDRQEEEEDEDEEGGDGDGDKAKAGDDEDGYHDDDDNDDSGDKGSDGEDEEKGKRRKRRLRQGGRLMEEEEEDEQEQQDGGKNEDTERGNDAQQERTRRKDRRRRIREYYYGTSYGAPSAWSLHRLGSELIKSNNETLWMAIVGLTDMMLNQRIDHDSYIDVIRDLESEVLSFNAARPGFSAADGTEIPASESGRIEFDLDYQFMLYRHWSLYDSMYHSNYVASKLQIWKGDGRKRLDELLAKMGFSLSQCKERYRFMDPQLKERLRGALEKHGPDYNLSEVLLASFIRYTQYRQPISASDLAYAVSALLDMALGGQGDEEEEEQAAARRFHTAYDVVGGMDETKLGDGLKLSMDLQRAVYRMAVTLMEKQAVTVLKHFRYAVVHGNQLGEAEDRIFTHPLALAKLALFLIDADRESPRWTPARARPLVLLAERRNTYLVIAVMCPERSGEVLKNRFGQAFRYAAEQIEARFRHDRFDTTVMEVDKEDVQRLIENLHYTMDVR